MAKIMKPIEIIKKMLKTYTELFCEEKNIQIKLFELKFMSKRM